MHTVPTEARIKEMLERCDRGAARRAWRDIAIKTTVAVVAIAIWETSWYVKSGGHAYQAAGQPGIDRTVGGGKGVEGGHEVGKLVGRDVQPKLRPGLLNR